MTSALLLLSLLLFVIVAIFFLVKIYLAKRLHRIYKPKGPYLLSPGEKRFFEALTNVITDNVYICPKVRIADLLDVTFDKSDPNFWKYLNAINQKHVDFVLCRKSDFAPLLVIELDGGSHNDTIRIERDTIVDNAFKDAGIPILHIPVSGYYEYKELRAKINQVISGN